MTRARTISLAMTGMLALAVVIGPSGAPANSANPALAPAAAQEVPSPSGQIEPAGPVDLGPDIEGIRQPTAPNELTDPALRAPPPGCRRKA